MAYKENKHFRNITNIVAIIMILSAILTLYNAFNSSIALKNSEIGMLKAVGMGDNELRLMVVGEGIAIGIVFIAIGIIVGKLGYQMTINLLEYNLMNDGTLLMPFKEIAMTYGFCILGIILSVW